MPTIATPTIPLLRRQTFQLTSRTGERIECRSGQVGITQDGDPRDVILRSGQCFTLDRRGQALVSALEDAAIVVRQPGDGMAVPSRPQARRHTVPPAPACVY